MKKTLTKEQQLKQNVLVAKDVLEMIPDLRLVGNWYIRANCNIPIYLNGSELQADIPRISKGCSVCAKGALILAHIKRFDGITELPQFGHADKYCRDIMGKDTADAIESAYEGFCRRGRIFKNNHPQNDERLREIMKNVIANGGTFKWPTEKVSD